MAFTVVAFSESQDTAVLANHAAVADPHVRVSGDDIVIPELAKLLGVAALGASITQAQLSSPQLRRTVLLDVAPVNRSATPSSPPVLVLYPNRMVSLQESESLNFLASEDAVGAAQQTGIVFLADRLDPIPNGEIFTVRATGSTTLTAYSWTNVAITFSQTLPAGRYAVVGLRARSTGLIAARLVFPGGIWRPGCLGVTAAQNLEEPLFRRGGLGLWGEFEHTAPPTVDCLSSSADTSEVFHFDIIKTR